jgi:hypothetical protein
MIDPSIRMGDYGIGDSSRHQSPGNLAADIAIREWDPRFLRLLILLHGRSVHGMAHLWPAGLIVSLSSAKIFCPRLKLSQLYETKWFRGVKAYTNNMRYEVGSLRFFDGEKIISSCLEKIFLAIDRRCKVLKIAVFALPEVHQHESLGVSLYPALGSIARSNSQLPTIVFLAFV